MRNSRNCALVQSVVWPLMLKQTAQCATPLLLELSHARVAAHSAVLVHRCQEVYRELGRLVRGAATDRDDHRSLRLLYLTPEKVRSYCLTAHTCASGSTAKPLVGLWLRGSSQSRLRKGVEQRLVLLAAQGPREGGHARQVGMRRPHLPTAQTDADSIRFDRFDGFGGTAVLECTSAVYGARSG
jgi:hypothetical protein